MWDPREHLGPQPRVPSAGLGLGGVGREGRSGAATPTQGLRCGLGGQCRGGEAVLTLGWGLAGQVVLQVLVVFLGSGGVGAGSGSPKHPSRQPSPACTVLPTAELKTHPSCHRCIRAASNRVDI